jgi:hypothetical protein
MQFRGPTGKGVADIHNPEEMTDDARKVAAA